MSVGDTLLLPFNGTATVKKIAPIGPRTQFVRLVTEHGATRIGVDQYVDVKVRVL